MSTGKSRRGFASMDPERLRQVSSQGGKGSTPEKRPFAKDRELARRAGAQKKPRHPK